MFSLREFRLLVLIGGVLLLLLPVTILASENNIQTVDQFLESQNSFCEEIDALAEEKGEQAFDQLFEMFLHPEIENLVDCIVDNLSKIDKDKAVDAIIDLYEKTEDTATEFRSAYALGALKDKKAIEPLFETFSNPGSRNKYHAAYALAALGDTRAASFLLSRLDNDSGTKRRSVRALSSYKNQEYCKSFYDLWLKDSDQTVQIEAGMAFISSECDSTSFRETEYQMDDQLCFNLQQSVDKVTKTMTLSTSLGEWEKSLNFESFLNQNSASVKDESAAVAMMNMVMGIIDWGESIDKLHKLKDFGSLEENKNQYIINIVEYRRKEEGILHYCPSLKFPDFSYWNEKIIKK